MSKIFGRVSITTLGVFIDFEEAQKPTKRYDFVLSGRPKDGIRGGLHIKNKCLEVPTQKKCKPENPRFYSWKRLWALYRMWKQNKHTEIVREPEPDGEHFLLFELEL